MNLYLSIHYPCICLDLIEMDVGMWEGLRNGKPEEQRYERGLEREAEDNTVI